MLQELAPCACGMRDAGGDCGGRCGGPAFSLMFPVTAGGGQLGYGGGPVDCTLSLATPSTRRAEAGAHAKAGGGSAVASCKEPARRCANCDTSSTPLWRNGPRGPKSLCNACGIRYKKEERRAAAAVAPAPTQCHGSLGPGSYACGAYARQHQPPPQWGCYGSAAGTTKSASFAAYGDSAAADGPCLSWMLNGVPSSPAFAVRERPSLFQYY